MKQDQIRQFITLTVVVGIIALIVGLASSAKRQVKKDIPNYIEVQATNIVPARDYQLKLPPHNAGLSEDSISVWDGERYVGKIFFTDDSEIGALIYKDNQ